MESKGRNDVKDDFQFFLWIVVPVTWDSQWWKRTYLSLLCYKDFDLSLNNSLICFVFAYCLKVAKVIDYIEGSRKNWQSLDFIPCFHVHHFQVSKKKANFAARRMRNKVPRSKEMCISSWYISRNIMAQCSICKHLSLSSNMFQRGCTSYYLNHSRLESLWYYISTNICAYLNFSLFDIYGLESHLGFNLRLIV